MGNKAKSIIVVFLVTLAVVGLVFVKNANARSYFSLNQRMNVISDGYSISLLHNFSTNVNSWTDWHYGNYSFSYSLPYGAWYLIEVYDLSSGKWDELVYIWDDNN